MTTFQSLPKRCSFMVSFLVGGREILCRAVQPTGQDGVMDELPGVLRQRHKHPLGHVVRELRIANHPQRGGIDEVHVPVQAVED